MKTKDLNPLSLVASFLSSSLPCKSHNVNLAWWGWIDSKLAESLVTRSYNATPKKAADCNDRSSSGSDPMESKNRAGKVWFQEPYWERP